MHNSVTSYNGLASLFDERIESNGLMDELTDLAALQERIRNTLDPPIVPAPRTKLTYQQLHTLFLQTARGMAQREGREFIVDEHNDEAIRHLLMYITGDTTQAALDLRKGLCLYGNPGTGKTFLMKIYKHLCETLPLSGQQFCIERADRISHLVEAKRTSEAIKPFLTGALCLDDLGSELPVVNVYSNRIAVLDLVLIERTERFVDPGLVT